MAAGLALAAIVPLTQAIVASRIANGPLSRAVSAGLGTVMADLLTMGLWVAVYGLFLAAATRAGTNPLPTPSRTWACVSRAWIDRRRATTGGTVLVGAGALLGGIYVVSGPQRTLVQLVLVGGIWLSYLGVALLTRLVQFSPADALAALPPPPGRRRKRLIVGGAVAAVAVLLLGAGAFVTTGRAAHTAGASGVPECNGETSLCDVPLNLAMFAGSHNAMSSALYPGWLFAEQTSTLTGQLDAGIRALLIDTHYGVPSTARLPGSETTVVITDRAAELAAPPGESFDPAVAARAQQIAANAPPKAGAQRGIYLCHNFCEMGAVSFVDQMVAVRKWLEVHPDQVVMTIIEDHTTPADTSAAVEAAGLVDRAWVLDPTQPMPTLGEMVDAGKNLLVFAENAGPGSPDWYQSAYTWFQETPYAWSSVGEMNCAPNRGAAGNKLMLINDWVGYSPPDPGKAGSLVNNADALKSRIEQCIEDRGVWPNVVAVDFAERGDLVKTVAAYNASVEGRLGDLRGGSRSSATTTTTVPGSAPSTTLPPPTASSAGLRPPTDITSLTGGDPATFCAAVGPFVDVMAGWALAELSSPAAAAGLPSLTYGPLVDRALRELSASAPDEIDRQLVAARDQAAAAVEALRQAGLTQAQIDAMADAMQGQLASANPDPAIAAQRVIGVLDGCPDARRHAGPGGVVRPGPPHRRGGVRSGQRERCRRHLLGLRLPHRGLTPPPAFPRDRRRRSRRGCRRGRGRGTAVHCWS